MKKVFYQVDGHTYNLIPSYSLSGTGRVHVFGVEMYRPDGEYIGYWHRENIPLDLLRNLQRHVKAYLASTPAATKTRVRKLRKLR